MYISGEISKLKVMYFFANISQIFCSLLFF